MSSKPLEKIGQLAFIVMCIAVAGAAGRIALTVAPVATAGAAATAPSGSVPIGTQVDLTRYPAGVGKPRLVLAISPKCQYCTESMPFYRRLALTPSVGEGRVALTVARVGEADELSRYLQAHEFVPTEVVGVRESGLRVSGTPLLVLLDQNGAVVSSWAGLLESNQEGDVIAAVEKAGRPR